MWKAKIKEKGFEIFIGVIVLLLALSANSIIDRYITPRVINDVNIDTSITPRIIDNLKNVGYLREEIKEGKHVVTDKKAFSDNNTIQSRVMQDLDSGLFTKSDQTDDLLEKVDTLNVSLKTNMADSAEGLTEVNNIIEELRQIITALTRNELDVTLFVSDLEHEKGFIVLNLDNRAISEMINNDTKYYIYSRFSNRFSDGLTLTARVESMSADNYDKHSAIGRMHRDDYHNLFAGSRSGKREAQSDSGNGPGVLFDADELDGWALGTARDDFKPGLKHGGEFAKLAICGNRGRREVATKVGGWLFQVQPDISRATMKPLSGCKRNPANGRDRPGLIKATRQYNYTVLVVPA